MKMGKTLVLALVGVCALAVPASAIRNLHSFCQIQASCPDGLYPAGGLAMDANGNLFGVTESGGIPNDFGVAYELVRNPDRAKWRFRLLYNFCTQLDCADGIGASGPLAIDTSGSLYGVTGGGGTTNGGVAYRLSPNPGHKKWTYTVLWTFCSRQPKCRDGSGPSGGFTYAGASSGALYDGHSALYGFTASGGNFSRGVAYSLTLQTGGSWRQQTLYNFCKDAGTCAGGVEPYGQPVLDATGNVYGSTRNGGAQNDGVSFKLAPVSGSKFWSETVLHDFCSAANCSDGAGPSSLAIDTAGNLFGTTQLGGDTCGGSGCGTLFEIASDGTYSVLYNFCSNSGCTDGADPTGVVLSASGEIFGTTDDGGNNNNGTVYRFNGALHTLYTFCKTDCEAGREPFSPPLLDGAGNLFGTTPVGGAYNSGAVYKLKQ